MKSDTDFLRGTTLYLGESARSGNGRSSITATVREHTLTAELLRDHDGPYWIVHKPFGSTYIPSPGTTAEEALSTAEATLRAEGWRRDRADAQRDAERQAHERRHLFDGLPTDLAGTVARLRFEGVLAADQTLSEKWWRRGLNKNRARRAMLGGKQCRGLIRRDCCGIPD